MSLHYLLDGYNILKSMPAFRDLPLEDGRLGFLRWIDLNRPQGSVNNEVTVVFDGHPDYWGNASQAQVRVIFSDGCSADDKIKRMVEEDQDQHNCVVVSDDKDVFLYARSLGAKVMSVAGFIGRDVKSHDSQKVDPKKSDKYISLSHQEKINKEFFQRWLGEKK